MAEYIGSRISLISKSDIRYVGTLHEINSETHTVALESVTHYGTEGRKGGDPSQEQAPSDQVFEYIVFRGSDVKDLAILPPTPAAQEQQPRQVPNDPAILGLTAHAQSARPDTSNQSQPPPQQQQDQRRQPPPPPQQQHQFPPHAQHNQQQFRGPQPPYPPPPQGFGYGPPPLNQFQHQPRFQGPGGPHGFPGSPGAVPGYGPPPPGYNHNSYDQPPPRYWKGGPPPGGFPQDAQVPIGPPGQQPPYDQQNGNRLDAQSLTNNNAPGQGKTDAVELSTTPAPAARASLAAPVPPVESKPSAKEALAPAKAQQPSQAPSNSAKPQPRANSSRVAIPLPPSVAAAKPAARSAAQVPISNVAQPATTAVDATQAATAAVAAAMAKLANENSTSGVDSLTASTSQLRVHDGTRGRGRGRGGVRGARRDGVQQRVDVPKEDYDFEKANAKFNKEELAKEAVAGSPLASPMNGDGPSDAPAASQEDVIIPPKPNTEIGYDKKSSFFDNISSDLKDRMESQEGGIDGRAIRREERSRNFETFGQGSVDGGYRGGYRGRGGRGQRGAGRGGTRGGADFRGGGFRGRGRGQGTLADV